MLILLSPAKTINEDVIPHTDLCTMPEFLDEAETIVEVLKKYTPSQLQKLMKINPKLADLNVKRYFDWNPDFTLKNAKQALLVFKGEVYNGLQAGSLTAADLEWAQGHLRILSGLYGVLRPLDLMRPYRLEMGTPLRIKRHKNLYEYWGKKLTDSIRMFLATTGQTHLINLASNEYFNVIDQQRIKAEIVSPVFKDYHNGKYKFMTVYGKKARGMMTRFIIRNKIDNVEQLKLFDDEGYMFNDRLSEGNSWVFTRG